jgi:hypothetical protein
MLVNTVGSNAQVVQSIKLKSHTTLGMAVPAADKRTLTHALTGRSRLNFDTQLDIWRDWRRLPRVTQSKNGVSGYAIVLL